MLAGRLVMAKKILVIEDDLELGQFIKKMLEKNDYNVISCDDGMTGLELIKNENPDLVLIDLLLPSLHGFDVCKKIKKDEQLAHIPVILMTAVYKGIMLKTEAKNAGANDFIEKPIKFDDLFDKIAYLTGDTSIKDKKVMDDMKAELEELRQMYIKQLVKNVDELDQIWQSIQKGKISKSHFTSLIRISHQLEGSGATFGFDQITEDSGKLKLIFKKIIEEDVNTIRSKREDINRILDSLKRQAIDSQKQVQ